MTTPQLSEQIGSANKSTPGAGCNRPEGDVLAPTKEENPMSIRRPSDMHQKLSANWPSLIDDDLQRDHWIDLQGLPERECPTDLADLMRVTKDVRAEGRDPREFDLRGIAVQMRAKAGDRHLDSVPDEEWTLALEWNQRAPWPTETEAA